MRPVACVNGIGGVAPRDGPIPSDTRDVVRRKILGRDGKDHASSVV